MDAEGGSNGDGEVMMVMRRCLGERLLLSRERERAKRVSERDRRVWSRG